MGFKLDHQPIAGEAYRRCSQIIIDNPHGGVPTVTFGQETIIGAPSGSLHVPMSPMQMAFDPAARIPVIDPETGEPTGDEITQADLYGLLYSAYFALASGSGRPDQNDGVSQ